MTYLQEIDSVGSFLSFVLWMCCAFGIGKALFRSFWSMELFGRILATDASRTRMLNEIQWELKNGEHFDLRRAMGDKLAAKRELNAEEIAERQDRLFASRNPTLLIRLVRFFSSCRFCHTFWGAVVLCAVTHRLDCSGVLAALAAAGAIALLPLPNTSSEQQKKTGCKGGDCK